MRKTSSDDDVPVEVPLDEDTLYLSPAPPDKGGGRSLHVTISRVLPKLYAESDGSWKIVIGIKEHLNPTKSLVFQCRTKEEQQHWVGILKQAKDSGKKIKCIVHKKTWDVSYIEIK